MGHRTASEGYRVLILAPFGRNAESVAALLRREGYDAYVCTTLADIADALDAHVGAVLITEEALGEDQARLREALAAQPDWSDPPFILLAATRSAGAPAPENVRERLPNVVNAVVLERPLGSASLVSAVASAMRSR